MRNLGGSIGIAALTTMIARGAQATRRCWSGIWARTRDKSNVYKGETDAASQIASQNPVALGHDLSQVVTAWGKLPVPLKAAILAIIKTTD
jgi:hypothetical protein